MIPAVTAPCIKMHTSHPPPSVLNMEQMREQLLHKELSPQTACLHPVATRTAVQFPEARLIQYDCGKFIKNIFVAFWEVSVERDWCICVVSIGIKTECYMQ